MDSASEKERTEYKEWMMPVVTNEVLRMLLTSGSRYYLNVAAARNCDKLQGDTVCSDAVEQVLWNRPAGTGDYFPRVDVPRPPLVPVVAGPPVDPDEPPLLPRPTTGLDSLIHDMLDVLSFAEHVFIFTNDAIDVSGEGSSPSPKTRCRRRTHRSSRTFMKWRRVATWWKSHTAALSWRPSPLM
jgi:hypothetical protein